MFLNLIILQCMQGLKDVKIKDSTFTKNLSNWLKFKSILERILNDLSNWLKFKSILERILNDFRIYVINNKQHI